MGKNFSVWLLKECMLINFSGITNNYRYNPRPQSLKFCGTQRPENDRFEKSGDLVRMKIFNPFTNNFINTEQKIDLKNSCVFTVKNPKDKVHPLIVDYDPSRTGSIKNKQNSSPIAVNILKTRCPGFRNEVAYHFMSKDLKHEYGHVSLCIPIMSDRETNELLKDYPEYGIVGPRAVVTYLQNWDDKNIGGVGKLADKTGVQFCLENGFEPNIVSYADTNSHVAHFKRGKRFITPPESSYDYEFLNKKYGKTNPNDILQELIQDAEWNGTTVDLDGWGALLMYLPEDMINQYR